MAILLMMLFYLIGVYFSYEYLKHFIIKKFGKPIDEYDKHYIRMAALCSWITVLVVLYIQCIDKEL